ncbi:MAG: AhpC/TSA family protein [Syntrophaceae bacterium PtaB.Bin095]|jgi:peroxiredoxin Q/BCP|nr:MAG: AhpC/TSA family protein [Syntrophaceae bacterium PtaB.Bin095]
MKQDFREFTSRNTTIVVVAPHSAEKVEKFWKEEELPMIGVPDKDGKLARLYGQEWKLLKLGRMPALFVVDRKGALAFAQYGKSMSDIPGNSEMLKVLDGLTE